MHWRRYIVPCLVVLAGWTVLATWQWREYRNDCAKARQVLSREAQRLQNGLVAGIRSHRRLGPFFAEQVQALVDEFAKPHGILAVGIFSADHRLLASAGRIALDGEEATALTERWTETGAWFASDFELEAQSHGPPGGGWGRGWGRRWQAEDAEPGPFDSGGRFYSAVVLDRSEVDLACRRALELHVAVAGTGSLAAALVGFAWLATVRMVELRGRTRALESESRHWRDLSQAAAGLAHETRNPLGLIRGWTQRLVQSGLPTAEQESQARAIVEECDRVTARINQFLAFARPREPAIEAVDLDRLIAELEQLIEPDLEAKSLRLERVLRRPRKILADPEMLRQALFNLLANAIHFSPENASIELVLDEEQNGWCMIEVADRGPGVSPSQVGALFSPYFTTRPGGTGLGLAIVRRIATAHGWEAVYRPRPEGGAVFRIGHINAA